MTGPHVRRRVAGPRRHQDAVLAGSPVRVTGLIEPPQMLMTAGIVARTTGPGGRR